MSAGGRYPTTLPDTGDRILDESSLSITQELNCHESRFRSIRGYVSGPSRRTPVLQSQLPRLDQRSEIAAGEGGERRRGRPYYRGLLEWSTVRPIHNRPGAANASNGIWLCQNCAKLIDSDVVLYTTATLTRWKAEAEREAQQRIGKPGARSAARSFAKVEQALKRDQKVRDEMTRALLKPPAELMATDHRGPQYRKFRETEFIVRRLDDLTYPGSDPSPGISGWFKLEVFDFYFNGIEGILNIEYVLISDETGDWSPLSSDQSDEPFPDGFHRVEDSRPARFPGATYGTMICTATSTIRSRTCIACTPTMECLTRASGATRFLRTTPIIFPCAPRHRSSLQNS